MGCEFRVANKIRKRRQVMKLKLVLVAMFAAILSSSCGVPMAQTQSGVAALPPCVADVIRDPGGKVIDVVPAAGCVKSDIPRRNPLFVIGQGNNRELVKEVGSYITFGEGTTTCYGPPIPSPPMCVCTRAPCP